MWFRSSRPLVGAEPGPLVLSFIVLGRVRGATPARFRCFSNETPLLDTWLILPVVICLSQRLSHACLSINIYTVKLRMAH